MIQLRRNKSMNEFFTLTVRKELSNFSYVTKVELIKGSFTDVIYLYIHREHTIKPSTDVLGRFASFNNISPNQDWIYWRWRTVESSQDKQLRLNSPLSLSFFTTIHCWTSWMLLSINDLDCICMVDWHVYPCVIGIEVKPHALMLDDICNRGRVHRVQSRS